MIILVGGLTPVILQTPISSASGSNEAAPASGPQPSSTPTSIWSDDFETGSLSSNWTITGSTNDAGVGTYTANSGKYSMYTRQGTVTVTSKVINLASYSKIQIKYWIRRGGNFSERPDSNEDLIVEYLDSKSSWIQLDKFLGSGTSGQVYNSMHNVTNATHSGFRIRFKQTGGSGNNSDYWHIDDVNILSLVKYDHDINVNSVNLPNEGKLGITIPIKATIMNIGKNNESNITIQLKIDSVLKNSTNITYLSVDGKTIVVFNWTPMNEKVYNVSIYAVPVTGENITTNNWFNTSIKVTAEPNIWITPKEFNLNATSGEITNDNLTIGNNGRGNLTFELFLGSGIVSEGKFHKLSNDVNNFSARHDLQTTYWSDGGNDAFDGYGFTEVQVGNVSQWRLNLTNTTYKTNGYNYKITTDWPDNNVLRIRLDPISGFRNDINVIVDGNLGSDSSTQAFYKSFDFHGFNIDYLVTNDGSLDTTFWDPQICHYLIPSNPMDLSKVNYSISGDNPTLKATKISLPVTIYIIPSYHKHTKITDWVKQDLVLTGMAGIDGKKWLEIFPDNGTISYNNQTKINLSANATNLDPGVYRTNISIISNDNANPLIRVPVNLTVLPAAHDIKILELEVPERGEVAKKVQVKATILNQGLNNEVNITVLVRMYQFY
jgi:hypothetical protein